MSQLQKDTMIENINLNKPRKDAVVKSSRTGFHYSYVILVVGIFTVLGALGLARFGYTSILPAMKTSLLLNNTQGGALATANLVGYTAFSLIGGFLAARFGPRLIIGVSMFLTGGTMFLTGLAGGFTALATARFLTGISSAGANIPMMGLASAWFGPKRRGLATGFLVGGSGLGLFVTGFLVPRVSAMSTQDGWRFCWYILGAIAIVLAFVSYSFLRNNPKEKGLLPLGVEPASTTPDSPAAKQVDSPVVQEVKGDIWKNVYASTQMWHLGLVYLLFGFEYIIYGTFFSTALVADKGFTLAGAGQLWAITGIIAIFSGILWGALSDVLGRKYAIAIVFALQAVCNYLIYAATGAGNILLVSVILYGLTCFSIPGLVAAACGDYVGAKLAPAALGMATLFFAVGQATAPSVAGYIADITSSFNQAFLLAAVVAAVGSLGSLTLRKPKHNF
ncbi:MAG: MFS transporter [Desulfotomaculaceae bacterium]|nr:MFS transporter [Desulfotomaculaceae bacterium]